MSERRPLSAAALEVARNRFAAIADEMGAVLRRAAYSPNIKEREDCSCALFTAGGEMLAQAEHIPVHLGSMPASVAAVLERHAALATGADIAPGDLWAVNDPFAGGTHLNDLTIVMPSYAAGRLVGFAANRAHHADVGGTAPGSMWAHATEIYQEGLRVPPVRVGRDGELDPWFADLFCANSRTASERRGDLMAQVGACHLGAVRLTEVCGDYGVDGAVAAMEEVLAYAERRMRAALAEVPDGVYRFDDRLDDGPRIRLALRLRGGEVEADFTGSDPQTPGNLNAVEAVTRSALYYALRTVCDPEIPANGGCYRMVRLVAPPGTVVAARPPAAVAAGNVEVSQRIADVCLGALAQALPDRVPAAGHGSMNNLLIGARGGPEEFVYYETTGGGDGGGPDGHGASATHTAMTNTKNTPVEALEHAYPLRVVRTELRTGSGGAGMHPGGDGIVREVRVLVPATVSLITERRTTRPWGLAGGQPGAAGRNWLVRVDGSAEPLPARVTLDLEPGEGIRVETAGGGGWGVAGDS